MLKSTSSWQQFVNSEVLSCWFYLKKEEAHIKYILFHIIYLTNYIFKVVFTKKVLSVAPVLNPLIRDKAPFVPPSGSLWMVELIPHPPPHAPAHAALRVTFTLRYHLRLQLVSNLLRCVLSHPSGQQPEPLPRRTEPVRLCEFSFDVVFKENV